ncbi:MAG TPA: hypothetical protein VKA76_07940 [Gammaproteobacteria bacterium]|nr:hypothetical protein [Gammaproteobacteria bacterium]
MNLRPLLPLAAAALLAGCASYRADTYQSGLQQMATARGVVVSLKKVRIAPKHGVGTDLGALAGAAGGAKLAGNAGTLGKTLGAMVGAIGGAVVGQKAQAATTGPALQVTVRLQPGGKLVSVVEQGYKLRLGEPVGITYSSHGKARVFPLDPSAAAQQQGGE